MCMPEILSTTCLLSVQDLLSWLEDSDMQNGAMPAGSPKAMNLHGAPGAAPKHQQAAEVCAPLHRCKKSSRQHL